MEALWSIRRPVGELRPGDHAWLAYESREEQSCVIGAFTRAGLAAGEKIIHVSDETTAARPDGGRLDARALLATLRNEITDAMEQGHRGVRIAADLTWALEGPGGLSPLADFERDLELLIGTATRATAVCQFDRRHCQPADLDALGSLHGIAVGADPEFQDDVLRIERRFHPPGLTFIGELDASRHSVLAQALGAARAHSRDGELHLDMSRLGFIDLGALNILAAHPIVLDRMPPQLRTVMDTVGWHMLPGLRVGT